MHMLNKREVNHAMKRKIGVTLVFLAVAAALLAGCAGAKLAEGFDREAVTGQAKRTVDLLNARDYEGVAGTMDATMSAALPADKLRDGLDPRLTELGEFEQYDGVTVYGQSSNGSDYAVAVVTAKYKNGTAVYTISFDKEMKLAGLYMK